MSESNGNENKVELGLRDDEVGQLFRSLVGPEDGPPDLSAAQPLKDALLGRGLTEWACHLERVIYGLMTEFAAEGDYSSFGPEGVDPNVGIVGQVIKGRLMIELGFLNVDFASAAGLLGRRVASATTPPPHLPEETQTVQVTVVNGPRGLRPGAHFRMPNRSVVTVVQVLADGRYGVVPLAATEDMTPGPPAWGSPLGRNENSLSRRRR